MSRAPVTGTLISFGCLRSDSTAVLVACLGLGDLGVLIATDDVTVDASSGWRAITDVNYVHRDYKQMR